MDPMDIETNVKRIVGDEIKKSHNDFLATLDNLLSARFQVFDSQQKERSESQLNRLHNDILTVDTYKFQRKSCEDQFKFNKKVTLCLKEADGHIEPKDEGTVKAKQKISEGIELLNYRQKLVKIADSSECGWKVVQEYTANPLADDSEDDKKIFRAQSRAERKIKADKAKKKRPVPYTKPAPSTSTGNINAGVKTVQRSGVCYNCFRPGHWQFECPEKKRATKLSSFCLLSNNDFSSVCNVDKLRSSFTYSIVNNNKVINTPVVSSSSVRRVDIDETCKEINNEVQILTPVGKLKGSIHKWQQAGASDYILKVIDRGYGIPFKYIPTKAFLKNNKSARDNVDFVNSEIDKLLEKGCISKVTEMPTVINPLTVAFNRSGKARLVLDCRHINECIHQFKFKLEDGSVARHMFEKGDYLYSFDLRGAYHHVEILQEHRQFLGFSWVFKGKETYFVFNVLPFGIASAGHIFTKLMKEVVKFYRERGLKIIMYLDDGLGGASDYDSAVKDSVYITWIGLVWDMKYGKLRITDDRVDRLISNINKTLLSVWKGRILYRSRFVACIVGQIISMQAVLGPLVRLKTRKLYDCINLRASWNSLVALTSLAVDELSFWANSILKLNEKGIDLHESDICDLEAFTDASSVGFGGYAIPATDCSSIESECDLNLVQTDCGLVYGNMLHTLTGSWSEDEKQLSSTWRELEAVNRLVKSSVDTIEDCNLKINTDNKNVTSIVKHGSRNADLHAIACELHTLCTEYNIRLTPQWIPREQNKIADSLSRYSDCDDWGIHTDIFNELDAQWGKHSVDRFATNYNTKCDRFNSKCWCKGTEAVDAFTNNWSNELNWLVPPPKLAIRVIHKICDDQANGTFIVPLWKSAPYWVLLCESDGTFKSFIKDKQYLTHNKVIVPGRGLRLQDFVREAVEDSGIEECHPLFDLIPSLSSHLLGAKSDSTVRKYFYGFKKWDNFINGYNYVSLPASPIHVALYLTHLLDSGCTYSTINTAFYSIRWAHEMCGKTDPTSNSFIQNLLNSAKRSVKMPVKKKDPVTSDMLIKLCTIHQFSNDLYIIRDLVMILISFSAFLRFNELSQLKCNDIVVKDTYLVIKIRKSKTDQYRAGDEVLVSKGLSLACQYVMFLKYVCLANLDLSSDMFLFRPLYRSKQKCALISVNKPISYTTARECVVSRLKQVAPELNLGLHSLRSGGATMAANSDVKDRCWKRHGRWKSESSKDGYVEDSISSRLAVSKHLGL